MMEDFNWEDVEQKISIICYRFDNLKPWHDDLAQELRIHAFYVSNNYYDLYRKAIDFWRKIQTRHAPEVPYFDLEVLTPRTTEEESMYDFDRLVELVEIELERPAYNKWDENMLELTKTLLNIILDDVDPRRKKCEMIPMDSTETIQNHYINHRLNLSWVAEETGIGYKRIVVAMKFLEDTVRGLAAMNKIEIPLEYFKGYYEEGK